MSLKQKVELLGSTQSSGSQKLVISFIGNGHPKDPQLMVSAFSNATDFEIRIIAQKIPRAPWHNVEQAHNLTVTFHQSVSTLEMFSLLASSHYVAFINHHDDKLGEQLVLKFRKAQRKNHSKMRNKYGLRNSKHASLCDVRT